MIADIAHGHVDGADILLLIAAILFGIVAILRAMSTPKPVDGILAAAGLCLVALAWLVL